MRFWDASAIVPLLVDEERSAAMRHLVAEDAELIVWWGTPVECTSAVRRREREGSLDARTTRQALAVLAELADSWAQVQPTDAIRAGAARGLAVHPLRTADALQLAAALTWNGTGSARAEVVCLDDRLGAAAAREGLWVLPEPQ